MTNESTPTGISRQHSIRALRKPHRLSWSADGAFLLVPADTGLSGELTIWSNEDQKIKSIIDCEGKPTSADFCVKYGDAAYGTQTGRLGVFDLKARHDSRIIKRIEPHQDAISSVAWSPNGLLLATASMDQSICILARESNFKTIRRIQATREQHYAALWAPSGTILACCGAYYGVHLYNAETGNRIWMSDPIGNRVAHDLAWSPRIHGLLAVALSDGRIWLLDSQTGARIVELEGHTGAVVSVAFSHDGSLLFSLAKDNTIRLWEMHSFTSIAVWNCRGDDQKYPASIACHPALDILAGPSERPSEIGIYEFDSSKIVALAQPPRQLLRTQAKVALVGKSGIGKSSVAMRLVERRYEPGSTTHGVRVVPVSASTVDSACSGSDWSNREILIWDLGGQQDYQQIHQLFLHETSLALIMFDPSRRESAYGDVEMWVRTFRQKSRGRDVPIILVGTKMDHDLGLIHMREIDALCKRLEIDQYVSTSAQEGIGFDELGRKIVSSIDWAGLERVVRPQIFQMVRDKLEKLRADGDVIITVPDLMDCLKSESIINESVPIDALDEGAVNMVVTQLSLQGVIAETRLADATRALVLQISEIERYAGALLLKAGNNASGIPAIDELDVVGASDLPGIPSAERLSRAQERIVIEAVCQILLQNGLCIRHEGTLVFPGKLTTQTEEPLPDSFKALFEKVYFSSAIENIYATLLASLVNSRQFGQIRPWPGRVEFAGRNNSTFGVSCIPAGEGRARLIAFASKNAPRDDCKLFSSYINEHFSRMGVEIDESLDLTCDACGDVILDKTIRSRKASGFNFVHCSCGRRFELGQFVEDGPDIDYKVAASRIRYMATQHAVEVSEKTSHVLAVAQPKAGSIRSILHLSDLHISGATDVDVHLVPLMLDLESQNIKSIDYLVISGDVVNSASESEYAKAHEFISALIGRLNLSAQRVIIAPGNHDVDWSVPVYDWKSKRATMPSELIKGQYSEQGQVYLIRRPDVYKERFARFSNQLYHLVKLKNYPLEEKLQFSIDSFINDGIQFIALNSSWQIDEFHPNRSSIHHGALAAAIKEAREIWTNVDVPPIRIAVFHHPAVGGERMEDDAYMELLSNAGVHLCLHGHVHSERAEMFNYLDSKRRIHTVGAGSFGSPANGRPESTPRLYNLMQIDTQTRTAKVFTRAARRAGGGWDEWCVWPNENGSGKLGWYEVQL